MKPFNGHHSSAWFVGRAVTKRLWQNRQHSQYPFYHVSWWYVWHSPGERGALLSLTSEPFAEGFKTWEDAMIFTNLQARYRCYPKCIFYIRQAQETYNANIPSLSKLH